MGNLFFIRPNVSFVYNFSLFCRAQRNEFIYFKIRYSFLLPTFWLWTVAAVVEAASSFSGRFHCAAVTSVISISCQTRKPTTCRVVDFPKNVKESARVGREKREGLGNQMFVSFHYMFTFVWGAPLTQIAIKRPKIVCLGQMKLAT